MKQTFELIQMDEFRRRASFVVIICLASVLFILVVWTARYILLLLFAGCIGALVISFLTEKMQSWIRARRSVAYGVVVVGLATMAGLGIVVRGPSLVHQIGTLQSDLPTAVQQIHGKLESTAWGRWLLAQATDPDQVSEKMTYVLSRIGGAMYLTATTVAGLFLVLLTTLYIGAEHEFYVRGIRRIVPASYRAQCEACLSAAVRTLRMWLVAKIVSMTVVGTLIAAGLLAVRVPLPGTLAIIAGLLTFIPNLGPILSVFPAALLAFAISPWKGLLTVLVFAIAHFLEGNIVTPLAERKLVKLPPALTLVVQVLLATVTGALGVALAAPLTAVALAVLEQLLPAEKAAAAANLQLHLSDCQNVSTRVQEH